MVVEEDPSLSIPAFAGFVLCYVPVTVFAAPVVFNIPALAPLVLRVIEVTVVTTPAGLSVTTFAGFVLGHKPPVLLPISSRASFHVVAVGVADVAGCARPVVLDVAALGTGLVLGDISFTVFAVPVVFDVAAFAGFIWSHLNVAVSAEPAHGNFMI